jgi:hypothetical protein
MSQSKRLEKKSTRNLVRCGPRLPLPALLLSALFLMSGGKVLAAKNPLNTIEADSFDTKTGAIMTEVCSEGGNNLSSIHNGDCAVYKSFDLDSGVAAFKTRIATVTHGSIEVRFDSPTGPLMGICSFNPTGGWQDWQDINCRVDNS